MGTPPSPSDGVPERRTFWALPAPAEVVKLQIWISRRRGTMRANDLSPPARSGRPPDRRPDLRKEGRTADAIGPAAAAPQSAIDAGVVMCLQRAAGNASVGDLLQQQRQYAGDVPDDRRRPGFERTRKTETSWGLAASGYGGFRDFDDAQEKLKGSVTSYTVGQPGTKKAAWTTYRVFTHGSKNFVEMSKNGLVFTYLTAVGREAATTTEVGGTPDEKGPREENAPSPKESSPPSSDPGKTSAPPEVAAGGGGTDAPTTDLAARIATCVGIWETNRGGDAPSPRESGLQNVAGLPASMATIEQATMPYAISAMKADKALRDSASPPLTMKELDDAETRCTAVVQLLKSVAGAASRGVGPDAYLKVNAKLVASTGLSDSDVATMFGAVKLRATIAAAHGRVVAGTGTKKSARQRAREEAALIPVGDRMGIDVSSLASYIKEPANWGENRAAWQRKAVNLMAGSVGDRIETVAESDGGAGLALSMIQERVLQQMAKVPPPTVDQLVSIVAQMNNPGEKNYGANVLAIYRRLYP